MVIDKVMACTLLSNRCSDILDLSASDTVFIAQRLMIIPSTAYLVKQHLLLKASITIPGSTLNVATLKGPPYRKMAAGLVAIHFTLLIISTRIPTQDTLFVCSQFSCNPFYFAKYTTRNTTPVVLLFHSLLVLLAVCDT